MMRSHATTVREYLESLTAERRAVVEQVRRLVRRHLPEGYQEAMSYGMISYQIPLQRYPQTYNGKPLSYITLAAQKHYYALYLMGCYAHSAQAERLAAAYRAAGKKLDMGKCCLRFRNLDDLLPDALGEAIASTTPADFIALYEASRRR